MEKIADSNYESKSYTVKYEEVVDAFLAMLTSDFKDKDIQTVKNGFYSLLTADMVDAAFKEAKRSLKEAVSDSRRIKDDAVNVEDAVYNAIMQASPAVQDAIVEVARDNYDLSEFESTEDLSNTIWNDIDYLVSQLPEDLQEDFADTYGF